MQNRSALAGQLAHQRKRDDALAGAWAAADDDDFLRVRAVRLLDGAHHQRERDLLLVEKHELLTSLYLVGGQREQLLAGAHGRPE